MLMLIKTRSLRGTLSFHAFNLKVSKDLMVSHRVYCQFKLLGRWGQRIYIQVFPISG